jgi:hypothetical protein
LAEYTIWEVVHQPDKKIPQGSGQTKFIKTKNGRTVHVITQSINQAPYYWLIVSTWVRGEDDKLPLTWLIITAPFRFIGWLTLWLFRKLFTSKITRNI